MRLLTSAPGNPPPVGSALWLPYPVTLSGGLWTDEYGSLYYAPSGASLGPVGSGAAVANAKGSKLFAALWTHLIAATPGWTVQTSAGAGSTAGAGAEADWTAGKRLIIPDQRGRSPIAAGQGSGLTNRAVGGQGGAETHPHTLSNAGHAKYADGVAGRAQHIAVPTYIANHRSTSSAAAMEDLGMTTGIGLGGSTDISSGMTPWAAYTVLWALGERA